jgi:small subunit ribosomal protein S20
LPSHKSCFKRMKTAEQERLRNRAFRSQLRTSIKELREESNKEEAAKKYREVTSLLDRASGSHLIHKRNADRNKARLAKAVQKLG